ncbi:right-handed parallel beta-helix repeat-containing protein [Pseudomonas brenneri]|uniref:right-handed parallel beta-helix repeat-containing protein n=1 Tax=Pseudomonas brenneri TaxID=129817 RepID=UPI003570B47E
MTVSTIGSVAEFVTNGVTTNYPFYFKFLANEDLVVTYVDPLGVSSVLTLGTQYTVSGAGNDQGGSVITTAALAGPGQLVVSREMDPFQQTSLRNQGKFLAETHEDVFDRLTMLIQQGFAIFKRALTRPFGRDYFHAEDRRIKNVKDPVDGQDAATRGWSTKFFSDLVDSVTGAINTTTGIFYDSGTLFDYLKFGVSRKVDTVADLRALSMTRNQRAQPLGYYVKGDGGGGPSRIAMTGQPPGTYIDNGGSVIVPNGGDGSEAWVFEHIGKINIQWFGGTTNPAVDNVPFALTAIQTGVSLVIPRGKTFAVSGIMVTNKSDFRVTGGGKLFLMNASNKPVLGATDCTSFSFDRVRIDGNKANQTETVQRNNGVCLFVYRCSDYEVTNNVAENGYSGAAILAIDNAADPTELKTNGRINWNKLKNCGVPGNPMLCDGIFVNSDNTEVIGNTITGMTDYGIAGDYSRNLTIHRNNISDVAYIGIGILGAKTWSVIGNKIARAAGGVYVTLSGNPATPQFVSDDVLIEGNQVSQVVQRSGTLGDAIFADPSATNIKVRGNSARDGFRGFAFSGTNVNVTNNDATDMTDRGFFVSGAGSYIEGNKSIRCAGGDYYGANISDKTLIENSPASGVAILTSLLNSWLNFGAPYSTAGYYRQAGRTYLRGVLKSGNTGGAPMFVLPVGYRPLEPVRFSVPGDSVGGVANILIDTSGNVIHVSGAIAEVHLKNISFVTA